MSSTIAACRVVWFRSRAAAARCVEEVALLEEEMRRTVRFFKYYEGDWRRKAISAQNAGLGGQAADARRSVMLTSRYVAVYGKHFIVPSRLKTSSLTYKLNAFRVSLRTPRFIGKREENFSVGAI